MAVIGIAAAFDDDIGVRLEQADELLAGRYRLPRQHPPLALRDNPLDQRLIMADLGLPKSNARLRSNRVALLLIDIDQCSDSSKQDLNAVMLKWAEGCPALIVSGPLTAVLLMELVRTRAPDRAFAFRAQAPLFDLAPFCLIGTPVGERVYLEAQGPDGMTMMTASADLAGEVTHG